MPDSNVTRCELVVPDAGPLITLAYADRLDLLLTLRVTVVVVDMVQHELTRHHTETSQQILAFLYHNRIPIIRTSIGEEARTQGPAFHKRHAGERAVQDFLFDFHDKTPPGERRYATLLFEDHQIAGTAFVLPDNVYLLSTRAFLIELEHRHIIHSAAKILQQAQAAGRTPSRRTINTPPKSNPGLKPF